MCKEERKRARRKIKGKRLIESLKPSFGVVKEVRNTEAAREPIVSFNVIHLMKGMKVTKLNLQNGEREEKGNNAKNVGDGMMFSPILFKIKAEG